MLLNFIHSRADGEDFIHTIPELKLLTESLDLTNLDYLESLSVDILAGLLLIKQFEEIDFTKIFDDTITLK